VAEETKTVGMPMMLICDEARRTQGGNNNAYCQDNETMGLIGRYSQSVQIFIGS